VVPVPESDDIIERAQPASPRGHEPFDATTYKRGGRMRARE